MEIHIKLVLALTGFVMLSIVTESHANGSEVIGNSYKKPHHFEHRHYDHKLNRHHHYYPHSYNRGYYKHHKFGNPNRSHYRHYYSKPRYFMRHGDKKIYGKHYGYGRSHGYRH